MANLKSAQKANRQRIKRQARNQTRRAAMRTAIKKVRAAIGDNKTKDATSRLKTAIHLIDRARGKGIIKPNTASRLVSRLTVAVTRGAAKA